MTPWFSDHHVSHAHSLKTLEAFYEFDDFMDSVRTVLDLGCGHGQDMLWWATRTSRDQQAPRPLNIRCTGVDLAERCASKHPNITYRSRDFETDMDLAGKKFDILWCHDAFQYCHSPYQTLQRWRDKTNANGMLVLMVPQTTNFGQNRQDFRCLDGCLYHWTLVNLMYVLALTGWDCRTGFFLKTQDDPWLHAVVYKTDLPALPARSNWYSLLETNLLPDSAVQSINKNGHVRQQDLVLPWIDKSLVSYLNY